jgi:hypothetical protein
MRLSRIDQHIKDEPCARQRSLLGVSPAVSQAFLVHSGEVRHKIVGHERVTLKITILNLVQYNLVY